MELTTRVDQFREHMKAHFVLLPEPLAEQIDKLLVYAETLAKMPADALDGELPDIIKAIADQLDRIEVFLGVQQVH